MTDLAELIERHKPLRERVFDLIKDTTTFTLKDVRALFPNETDKTLYRVIKELETQKRIRFLDYVNRSKLYTAIGSSELPMLVLPDNSTEPCSSFLRSLANNGAGYSEHGLWSRLEKLNRLPITISSLFVVAQAEDVRNGWIKLQQELIQQRKDAMVIVGYLDSIIKHPTMNGDLEKFKAVFDGEDKALPNPEEMGRFKVWFNKIWRGELGND